MLQLFIRVHNVAFSLDLFKEKWGAVVKWGKQKKLKYSENVALCFHR